MTRRNEIPLIVISGLPGSGKTTLAQELAPKVCLPLIDKDDILDSLFEAKGIGDADWRRKLSRESDEILRDMAGRSAGAVLSSFWRHSQMPSNSGTPTDWIGEISDKVVEIYCVCDIETAATRFYNRKRHPGHLDGSKSMEDLRLQFKALAEMGPLGIGELIRVDTSGDADVESIAAAIGFRDGHATGGQGARVPA